jgi:carbon-monoxide dehydrogenase medium subunit
MKPARFAYRRAGSVGEALTWLADEANETKILAGGQSLVPLLNMRLARPGVLVDVNPIRELSSIHADNDGVRLGALVRHTDLINSALVAERAPLLAEAVRHIGHRAIRNVGTLGGSLAHADPAAG